MAQKTTTNKKTKHTIEFSNNTLLVLPALGQPCQLNTIRQGSQGPGFGHLRMVTAPVGITSALLYPLDLCSQNGEVLHE